MTHQCPMCKRPMKHLGKMYAFRDDAQKSFTFGICHLCAARLTLLPMKIQRQQERACVGNVAAHADRYQVKAFDSWDAAYLYINLETELHAEH